MKSRTMMMCGLICAVALLATFEYSGAAQPRAATSKIGVVSIRTVFKKTRQQALYQNQALAKRARERSQLEGLAKEIKGLEDDLSTYEQGTPDYLSRMQTLIQKRYEAEGRQEFLKQQRMQEDKLWMEKLYQETLKIVNKLAQDKGLDLVLEQTVPDFPISSDELMATFSTHKVLYAGGAADLTDEVLLRLDALALVR